MRIIRQASARESAGEELHRLLQDARTMPVLLLLSGGSNFSLLNEIAQSTLGANITIGMLDERADARPEVNNFAQLAVMEFYAKATAQGVTFIDSRLAPYEQTNELAERMDKAMFDWLTDHQNGKVIATIGVGKDGHTAGILPFPEDPQKFTTIFEHPNRLVIGYDAGEKSEYKERATATLPLLRNHISEAIVYVAGEEKRPALARVLAEQGTLAETPGRILREMKRVSLFTDIEE